MFTPYQRGIQMKHARWTKAVATVAAIGTLVAAGSPVALAAPRGLHLGHPVAASRGHHENITLTDVQANAAAVQALYQQYQSLLQSATSSSGQSPAVAQLISELQSDLTALQNASTSQAARQAMNQILKQVAQAESALRDHHALTALEQQISKEYSQFTQEMNQLTSSTNPPAGQLRQLWNLENLLIAKLREAIRDLGAIPTPSTAQSTSGSTTSSTSNTTGSSSTSTNSTSSSSNATSTT